MTLLQSLANLNLPRSEEDKSICEISTKNLNIICISIISESVFQCHIILLKNITCMSFS